MAKAKQPLSDRETPYDRDFVAWTQQQAALLRRAATHGPTPDLDLANLVEEIESLGKRDRRALMSRIARITEHLLKLKYSRMEESRPGWRVQSMFTGRRLGGSWRTVPVSDRSWRRS